jgi:hypothetical protein
LSHAKREKGKRKKELVPPLSLREVIPLEAKLSLPPHGVLACLTGAIGLAAIATRSWVGVTSRRRRITRASVAIAGAVVALSVVARTTAVVGGTAATGRACVALAATVVTSASLSATCIAVNTSSVAVVAVAAIITAILTVAAIISTIVTVATVVATIIAAIIATVVATVIAISTVSTTTTTTAAVGVITAVAPTISAATPVVKATAATRLALGRTEVLSGSWSARTSTTSLLDAEGTALNHLTLQTLLSGISLVRGDHLHEAEATRLSSVGILHDLALLDLTVLLKEARNLCLLEARVDTGDEEVGTRVDGTIVIILGLLRLHGSTVKTIGRHGAAAR